MARARSESRRWPLALVAIASTAVAVYFVAVRGGGAASLSAQVADASPPRNARPPRDVEKTAAMPTPSAPPPPPAPSAPASSAALPAAPPPAPPAQEPEPAAPPSPSWKSLLEAERYFEARKALAEVFLNAEHDNLRLEAAEQGTALNKRLLMTHPDDRDVEFLPLVQGQNPTTFSRQVNSFHGEPGLLFLLNGLNPGRIIRAGAKLRVTRGRWSLFADKSLYTLWLCYEGVPFKAYPTCIGTDDKTPATRWTVGIKNPKPSWTAPAEWLTQEKLTNPIPYGHAKNPLGEYWIGLDAPGYFGFGIHGTNEPHTIGTKASNGCIRLLNHDVIELAACVWKGMEVVTVE
ncbi:MAG: L,D-transpeptidase [Planctomycetes bacterium]|nr:L,D-transpeptidase [Planctomycetota bacterium]